MLLHKENITILSDKERITIKELNCKWKTAKNWNKYKAFFSIMDEGFLRNEKYVNVAKLFNYYCFKKVLIANHGQKFNQSRVQIFLLLHISTNKK